MRRTIVLLTCLTVMLAHAWRADARDGIPHLRGLDGCATALVADARERSATVRELEARLDRSDVVAYVDCVWPQAGEPEAVMVWVSETPALRYVLLRLSFTLSPWRRVEMLGHEMQHAAEVAGSSEVRDEPGLQRLFQTIGRQTARMARFETEAAKGREHDVRRELARSATAQTRIRPS